MMEQHAFMAQIMNGLTKLTQKRLQLFQFTSNNYIKT